MKIIPTDLWNSIMESKFPIMTAQHIGLFYSRIHFYDRSFSESDSNFARSRNKVAVRAISQLFGVYYQYWNEYSLPRDNPTTSPFAASLGKYLHHNLNPKSNTTERERSESIKFYQERAKGEL